MHISAVFGGVGGVMGLRGVDWSTMLHVQVTCVSDKAGVPERMGVQMGDVRTQACMQGQRYKAKLVQIEGRIREAQAHMARA